MILTRFFYHQTIKNRPPYTSIRGNQLMNRFTDNSTLFFPLRGRAQTLVKLRSKFFPPSLFYHFPILVIHLSNIFGCRKVNCVSLPSNPSSAPAYLFSDVTYFVLSLRQISRTSSFYSFCSRFLRNLSVFYCKTHYLMYSFRFLKRTCVPKAVKQCSFFAHTWVLCRSETVGYGVLVLPYFFHTEKNAQLHDYMRTAYHAVLLWSTRALPFGVLPVPFER